MIELLGYHVHYIGNENGSFIAPAVLWVSFVHLAVDYTLLNNIIDNDIAVRCRTLMFYSSLSLEIRSTPFLPPWGSVVVIFLNNTFFPYKYFDSFSLFFVVVFYQASIY